MKIATALVCLLLLTACGHRWGSDQYADSAEAKRALASTKKLCQDYAQEMQALNYGFNRYSRVDQPLEDMANTMHNWVEDQSRQDLFTSCMQDHGWKRY